MTDFARYLNIRSALSPELAPDGQRVAFLADITGVFQAWSGPTQPRPGEWPRQLTFFQEKVWEIRAAAGQPWLVAVSDVGGNERQQLYWITGYGGPGDEDAHQVQRLTRNDQAIHRFGAWSRDGQRILLTSNARNGVDFDLYVLEVETGQLRLVRESQGNRVVAAWSPDEGAALVLDAVGPLEIDLYRLDLTDPGAPEQRLTQGQPPARYGFVHWTEAGIFLLTDRTHDRGAIGRLDPRTGEFTPLVDGEAHPQEGELEWLAVSSDGRQAAYIFNHDGASELFRLDLGTGQAQPVAGIPWGVVGHLSAHPDGSLLFDFQSPDRNPDVWRVSGDGQVARLTDSDRAGIPRSSFVTPELVRYQSFDGLSIPAFYYRPQTSPPAGGYPCILYVHGGPTSQIRPDFDVRFQYFLSQGYAILAPNVRGSTGYGRAYAALDEVEKRMDSVADLKHAVLWLQQRPEIDPKRIAIYGRSYGGYMVLAALTEYPELFAAGIDVVGIANWVSFLERTSPWRRAHREREYGSLARHRDVLERISPIHKAERITMPLLVIAGDNDPRVPLFESEQIVERVRKAGGTVEFLHYPDEGHKISKLANRVDSFSKMAEFLRKFV